MNSPELASQMSYGSILSSCHEMDSSDHYLTQTNSHQLSGDSKELFPPEIHIDDVKEETGQQMTSCAQVSNFKTVDSSDIKVDSDKLPLSPARSEKQEVEINKQLPYNNKTDDLEVISEYLPLQITKLKHTLNEHTFAKVAERNGLVKDFGENSVTQSKSGPNQIHNEPLIAPAQTTSLGNSTCEQSHTPIQGNSSNLLLPPPQSDHPEMNGQSSYQPQVNSAVEKALSFQLPLPSQVKPPQLNIVNELLSKPERKTRPRDRSGGRTFKCEKCSKVFARCDALKRHMVTHSTEKLFRCEECDKKFARKDLLVQHKVVHSKVKPFECSICQKRFSLKSGLSSHLHSHSSTKPYLCEICLKIFSHQRSLNQHLITHSKEKAFECEMCHRKFARKDTLKQHFLAHTQEKPFQCELCMKEFSLRSNLRRHLLSHREEKPYQCEICMKRFTQRCHLTAHIGSHNQERPHQCKICLKFFSRRGSLRNHLLTHDNRKPHQCEICNKRFSRKDGLSSHILTHRKEKPYECNICHKKFSQKGSLTQHGVLHSGTKPFQCAICLKRFSFRSNLTKHGLNHHPEASQVEATGVTMTAFEAAQAAGTELGNVQFGAPKDVTTGFEEFIHPDIDSEEAIGFPAADENIMAADDETIMATEAETIMASEAETTDVTTTEVETTDGMATEVETESAQVEMTGVDSEVVTSRDEGCKGAVTECEAQ